MSLSRSDYFSWALYAVTGIFMTVGGALMYTIKISSPSGNVYGYSVLIAIGSGLTYQAGYAVAGVKVSLKGWSSKDVQSVMSLQNISQIGGTLLSLLISGQVFQSLARKNLGSALSGQGFSDTDIRSAIAGTQSTLFERLSPQQAESATQAITDAMSRVYILSVTAGALSLISALLMKKERLFGVKAAAGGG